MRVLLWAAPVSWAALIFLLSGQPGDDVNVMLFPHADKVVHILVFGLLAHLLFMAFFRERTLSTSRSAIWAFGVTAIYGAIDELHQLFVTNRHAGIGDWFADIAGAVIVLSIVTLGLRKTVNE